MSGKMIAVSPKRQLDEALGIMRHQNAKHRGDWCKWHCGDRVYDEADERHIGVIEGITNSATAKVRNGRSSPSPKSTEARAVQHGPRNERSVILADSPRLAKQCSRRHYTIQQ